MTVKLAGELADADRLDEAMELCHTRLGMDFGTGSVHTATASRDNSYLDGNGNLVIAALYNAGSTPHYTSAHLKTANSLSREAECGTGEKAMR